MYWNTPIWGIGFVLKKSPGILILLRFLCYTAWEGFVLALKELGLHFLCITRNTTRKKTWKLEGHCNFSLHQRAFRVSLLNSLNNWTWRKADVSPDGEISFKSIWSPNHAFVWVLLSLIWGELGFFVVTGGTLLQWEAGISVLLCPNACYLLFQRKMGFWLLDDWWNGLPVRRPSWEVVAERWRRNWEIPTC